MTNDDKSKVLLKRLNEVFCHVFNDDSIVISESTSAKDIDDWDSLMHITLIVSVEREFGVKLKVGEVVKLKCVGDLLAILLERATK